MHQKSTRLVQCAEAFEVNGPHTMTGVPGPREEKLQRGMNEEGQTLVRCAPAPAVAVAAPAPAPTPAPAPAPAVELEAQPQPLRELQPEPEQEPQRGPGSETEHVSEGVPPARALPPPVGASIAVQARRTAGQADRVAALEEALQCQINAGERREQVLKKQHHVALLGLKAHHSAELARRDDQIAKLQKVVQTQQQQHKSKDVEILRLRRQLERSGAAVKTVEAQPQAVRDRTQGSASVEGAAPTTDSSSVHRRWSSRRNMLTIAVLLVVPCAVLIAVPGGAYVLQVAVATLTLRELLVEVGDSIAATCTSWQVAVVVFTLVLACGAWALRGHSRNKHSIGWCTRRPTSKRE